MAKGSWVVKVRCTVEKMVYVEDCTEEEANADPFAHAVDENEIGQLDFQVLDVKPNT